MNRKECAQVLVNVNRWLAGGVFIGTGQNLSHGESLFNGGNWQLESTLIETSLSRAFSLPNPTMLPPYFSALVCELCRLSPATFGPAVGKCFRKIYEMTGDGLDVEISRRFSEWFAIHMSNFEFRWPPWNEWSPDLNLPNNHPKKIFIRRVLEIEVRLSYHDRILRSIPESFRSPDAAVISDQSPGPDFAYGDPNHPNHGLAQEILNWLQGRTDPAEVIKGVETHRERLVDAGETDARAFSILRQVIIQSLLEIGARSFSHFLNAVERYIKLIRYISAGSEAKPDILESITRFWKKNPQMMLITFDKFLQYQFTDPSDHITWAFTLNGGFIGRFEWDIIKNALNKAIGRVFVIQNKVDQLRKEQDDAAALKKAQENADMESDANIDSEGAVPQTAALTSALNSKESLLGEQQRSLLIILEKFIESLSSTHKLFDEEAWRKRSDWSNLDYKGYETWGWFRHLCRSYNTQLLHHSGALSSLFEEKMLGKNEIPDQLIRKYWALTLGESRW